MKFLGLPVAIAIALIFSSCGGSGGQKKSDGPKHGGSVEAYVNSMQTRLSQYETVKLTADVSGLSQNQQEALRLMIQAADIMDNLFWYEAYGNKGKLLDSLFWIESDKKGTSLDLHEEVFPLVKRYIKINYGPWDRLDGNASFVKHIGAKPKGANFYPKDMTKKEFEAWDNPEKTSAYTFVRRDENGKLKTIPYREKFGRQVKRAAELLRQASGLVESKAFGEYLKMRADALLTDDYQPSDLAWMDVKDNQLELVIGPIENYEDQLYGYKSAHEAFVLIKDMEWSKRLDRYAKFLPELQAGLPVEEKYKKEVPGTDSDLGAYDAVYYAGDCNAGSKTIAINLPNDEEVQKRKGTRRLQLKNVMRFKFDKIMVPISNALLVESQRKYVTFDAFFANTMFHEVAHGLGIKNVLGKDITVRAALKDYASSMEEGKADVLGLYMVTQLSQKGELDGDLKEFYTTFLAGIFRSVRFGASSAHGRANMIRFNFFKERGAFTQDATGLYKVDYDKFRQAMDELSEKILMLQGNGDYEAVKAFVGRLGVVPADLEKALDKLHDFGIPKDIIFDQGIDVLGLKK
ncbi:hypothetical protein FUAX_08770 [Fulvitalea axinellae]|uniref:Zn-dependent hydrolase n=1 Tax=Fulvitalea axinellae TaxID=1182444 RepID=A0AAU9D877_9BACT|nr:hypothetical protein FUAX_08770 [Fulvitalea axinellae]